ncbi:putative lysine-specific demethylase 4A [Frankliniella fusca]|uniref:Lysine-specific demethylase 4A n=1 Tax=Frankliniella fusca TaxID=407009 RepID=A0AAE1LET3_9NEOP|nr:putative lysine-specific demethylase 4A [Frankliniella fusca]
MSKYIVQEAGEAVVLYPDAAHMGWNAGWNMAEAINFGTVSWIEHGMQSLRCQCLPQQVHLDLRKIVAAFKPHLLSPWLKGQYIVNSKERSMINMLSNAVQERLEKPNDGGSCDTMRFLDCPVGTCSKKYPFHGKRRLENHVQREHKPLLEKLDLLEKINEQHKKLKMK